MKNSIKFAFVVILLLSIVINFYLFNVLQNPHVVNAKTEKTSGQYPLLAKEVASYPENDRITNFLSLRQQLKQMINLYKDKIAVYFEYLPTGTSIGFNEDTEFTAASLLKVPVVMAYFHRKERLGMTSDPTVVIQEKHVQRTFGSLYKRGVGTSIDLADAVKLALQQSDNTAGFVLRDQISKENFEYVYHGLDIEPKIVNNGMVIAAEQFSTVLKALYFSSILTKEHSQYILDLLTDTDFSSMLPSGVPSDVSVAHKIGLIDNQIYSDCGIVYVPNRPYILCVASQSDEATAEKRIREISKTVYEYVAGYKVN